MNARGVAERWPVLLGGAALTRAYVEDDLPGVYRGEVRYARDAFEGLRLMDRVMAASGASDAGRWTRTGRPRSRPAGERRAAASVARRRPLPPLDDDSVRSDVGHRATGPDAAVLRHPGGQGHPAGRLRVHAGRTGAVPRPVGAAGRPGRHRDRPTRNWWRPRAGPGCGYWLDRFAADQVLEAAVVYGYFPCYSEGNDLVVLDADAAVPSGPGSRFPRQRPERRLCLADFFRPPRSRASLDVVALQWSPWASRSASTPPSCSRSNAYRDYLEVHGLSVQLTEALAEYWHRRIRAELRLPSGGRSPTRTRPTWRAPATDYRGCRYSFGYPACPDLEDRAQDRWRCWTRSGSGSAVGGVPAASRSSPPTR